MPAPATTVTSTALPEHPLRAFRTRAGISMAELASLTGVSYPHIAGMERGHRPVSLRVLHALRRLGFDADRLEAQCEDWTARRNALIAAELRSTAAVS